MTTTEFVQGKTWRWGIAWSFDPSLKSEVYIIRIILFPVLCEYTG